MKLTKNTRQQILKSNLLPILLLIIIVMVLPLMGISQDPPGPGDTGGGSPDAGSVPIDGGLSLVIAAGVGYGAKKIRDYNKKKKEEAELDL